LSASITANCNAERNPLTYVSPMMATEEWCIESIRIEGNLTKKQNTEIS
jgi:hypothetical protein